MDGLVISHGLSDLTLMYALISLTVRSFLCLLCIYSIVVVVVVTSRDLCAPGMMRKMINQSYLPSNLNA